MTVKFLKYLLPTMLVLCVIPFSDINNNRESSDGTFGHGKIRVALDLNDRLSDGYQTGYGYEMAERFASHMKEPCEIFLALEGGFYLDSLRQDSLDILMIPSEKVPDSKEFLSFHLGEVPVSWLIKTDKQRQKDLIRWLNSLKGTDEFSLVIERFFHGYNTYRKGIRRNLGIISPYDDLIKEYAREIGWDWKMFAALIWSESRFRIQASSPMGALGLMQMMPRTADRYEIEDLLNPRENIAAGAAYIARLQSKFKDIAANDEELLKFTLAAYNAGEGRLNDCIKFARSQGVDTGTWESLCSVFPLMSRDTILSVDDVRHGKFKGKETIAYVRAVLNRYDIFRGAQPRFSEQPTDTTLIMLEDTEDVERILLSPDSLGRINLGDEQARNQEQEHDDNPGDGIGGKHHR